MEHDLKSAKREALSALRAVADVADGAGARSLAGRLREGRIPRLEEEQFHLVVLGEFNHGKTTFVNALLGSSVLPTGVTPTTAHIHHIAYGRELAAELALEGGERTSVTVDGLDALSAGGEGRDSVLHVNVCVPAPLLEGGVVLVDTPGVNDLNDARAEVTYGYLPRADAVLFVLDAGQVLKESERAFVADKLFAGVRRRVFFVVNKMDVLSPTEQAEALAYTRSLLNEIAPNPRVFGLSARRALEGDREGSRLEAFVDALRRFLHDERGRVLLENALTEGMRATESLRTGVQIQRRALSMEQEELDRRLALLERDLSASAETLAARVQRVRESLAGIKALVREDVTAFGGRFAATLRGEVEAADPKDLRRYLAGFVEERLHDFAADEAELVAERLEKVAEEAIAFLEDDAEAQRRRLESALGESAPGLDLKVNTFAYDVSVFALGAFGVTMMALSNVLLGGALALSAPVMAWFLRGRIDQKVRERAIEEAPRAVTEAAAHMADAFEQRIDAFGTELIQYVTEATHEMIRNVTEVVERAREARAGGEAEREELERRSGMALVQLADLEGRMERLRASLFSNGGEAREGEG